MNFFFKQVTTPFNSGYFAANKQYIEQLPIRQIDFSKPADAAKYERVVSLVNRMLTLHRQLASAYLPQDKELIQRHIDTIGHQIDSQVYDLYDLTEAERKVVEEYTSVSKKAE